MTHGSDAKPARIDVTAPECAGIPVLNNTMSAAGAVLAAADVRMTRK